MKSFTITVNKHTNEVIEASFYYGGDSNLFKHFRPVDDSSPLIETPFPHFKHDYGLCPSRVWSGPTNHPHEIYYYLLAKDIGTAISLVEMIVKSDK